MKKIIAIFVLMGLDVAICLYCAESPMKWKSEKHSAFVWGHTLATVCAYFVIALL